MAQLFNRIGQLGLGLCLAGGVVNSALYNGLLLLLHFIAFCVSINLKFQIRQHSRWWSSSCNIRSIPRHQTIGCR